jgi:hypothetical protein
VPDAALAVNEQIERNVHQIGNIRRRHHDVAGGLKWLARPQDRERLRYDVVAIPRTEKALVRITRACG